MDAEKIINRDWSWGSASGPMATECRGMGTKLTVAANGAECAATHIRQCEAVDFGLPSVNSPSCM